MSEQITKLSPNRDLQAYFLTPSAIAAISSATSSSFVLSGKWRQQFDWAVVEWNRDNVFEHPSLRYLPDGDLSGLTLIYTEQRTGCIPFRSTIYPVVDWHRLRLWVANADLTETVYYVTLADKAVPVSGSVQPASATMTLMASPGQNRVGLAFSEEHYYFQGTGSETLSVVAAGIAAAINTSQRFTARSNGASVTVFCNGPNAELAITGDNGNRVSMYGFSEGGVSVWQQPSAAFAGGAFPSIYQVTLNFANLMGTTDADPNLQLVPTANVRKLRWTWAADLQNAEFVQTEFEVNVTGWSITGSNQTYNVAGPGSRRIEDTDSTVIFAGGWNAATGNYSGSKVHYTSNAGGNCTITYTESSPHEVYLGLRRFPTAPPVNISIDGPVVQQVALTLNGEDVLIRQPLGTLPAGSHRVVVSHAGQSDQALYFDFLEIVYPTNELPDFPPNSQLALATDWDTYHSQSLPAERTAWLIHKLGFSGRVNHYVGALWFYEIFRPGTQYANVTVNCQLTSSIAPNAVITVALAADQTSLASSSARTEISHLVLPDDTSSTVAQAFAGLINAGINLVWASVNGSSLILTARAMGTAGNGIGFELLSTTTPFTLTPSSSALTGGVDGTPYDLQPGQGYNDLLTNAAAFWRTDLTTTPRVNRAARDWHAAYFAALKAYGMDVVAAFSTELGNGDPSSTVGIAQVYPDATPVVLNTPAIQTNFSPTSLAYWQQAYLDIANLQNAAGLVPYLQSGEVQWWYFPNTAGMPFYDAYTQQQFSAKYGSAMQTIPLNTSNPSSFPNEVAFLPALIGAYTASIRAALQMAFPNCRYEVLYPTDTNNTALNSLINYPATDWTPQNLTCLKTESFTFTGGYDLVSCTMSMNTSAVKGFPNSARAHLVGIGDAWSAWLKEVDIAQSQGLESVVLFALDQYCLIGYPPPPFVNSTNSSRQG
jgi:hypothetical protein